MNRRFTQLTPNLWVAQSKLYHTNSGIFLSEDTACLIDPCMFPGEIESIAGFVKEYKAVTDSMILTHSHWDHILGPERFPGVKTIAHVNYLQEISGEGETQIKQQISNWETQHGIERNTSFEIPVPDETFTDELTVEVGAISLRLIPAQGHAADQLVVYHGKTGTLWASDMLSDMEIPFISDSLSAYEGTLETLAAWDIRVLIPGHGHPTSDATEISVRLADDIAYLDELRERVERAVQRGKTVNETVELCADMHYRHPEDNKGPHKLNVESVYVELGGEADPTQVGWHTTSD